MEVLPFGGLKGDLKPVNLSTVISQMFLQEDVNLPIVFSKVVSCNTFLWVGELWRCYEKRSMSAVLLRE